ncbi:MAG: class I tRNA ligase family protein, partial [Myxococcales bacterium]|nr:class I tRNA ligase family protein [Myxococcales bacterium]
FHHIFHGLNNFCSVDLSARYLDILKDRLYCEAPNGRLRRSAQTTVHALADGLTRLMTPVLTFLGEELWGYLPGEREPSAHLALMPSPVDARLDAHLEAKWSALFELRDAVNAELEKKRAGKEIGHSLDARVSIRAPEGTYRLLEGFSAQGLADFFIVSQCVASVDGTLSIEVGPASGEKCARCWKFHPDTGADEKRPGTCPRCAGVLAEIAGA